MKKIIKYSILSTMSTFIILIVLSVSPIYINHSTNNSNNNSYKYLIIGHRGAAGLAPENTISAIKKGIENQVDRIEIDVHQTKDNKVVVIHDKTLDRTTNGSGLVKSMTYKDIQSLDAGSWFSPQFKNEKIPLLEDVIKEVNGKTELIIEIKEGDDFYPSIIENVINIINKYNATDWCIIHSFDTEILEKVHKLEPNIKLHKLFFGKISYIPIIIDNGIEYYDFNKYPYISEYSINYNFANKRIIEKIKKIGKKINVWTIDDKTKFEKLKELKINGFITDFPNIIK